jgi:hypothetical protein
MIKCTFKWWWMVFRSFQRHHFGKKKKKKDLYSHCQEQCLIFGDYLKLEVLSNPVVLLVKSLARVKNRVDIPKTSLRSSLDVINHVKDTSNQSTTPISKLI